MRERHTTPKGTFPVFARAKHIKLQKNSVYATKKALAFGLIKHVVYSHEHTRHVLRRPFTCDRTTARTAGREKMHFAKVSIRLHYVRNEKKISGSSNEAPADCEIMHEGITKDSEVRSLAGELE